MYQDNIVCPKCGSSMVLRTAHKGCYAGQAFYGCSNYPGCDGKVKVDQGSNPEIGALEEYNESNTVEIPVNLFARAKFKKYQAKFYQTVAVPEKILKNIGNGAINKKRVERISQWRLDYPEDSGKSTPDYQRQLFQVTFKILTRGRVTLLSPWLEEALRSRFNPSTDELEFRDDETYEIAKFRSQTGMQFDGCGFEKDFYEKILYKMLGERYKKYVLPQVFFSSLLDDEIKGDSIQQQRPDFLINVGDKKIIVEIDEEAHKQHSERDNLRDQLLSKSGYEVIRIPVEEVSQSVGPNLDRLEELTKKRFNTKFQYEDTATKYILALKMAHQLQIAIVEALNSGFISIDKQSKLFFDYTSTVFNKNEAKFICKNACKDLKQLIEKLFKLYDRNNIIILPEVVFDIEEEANIAVSYDDNLKIASPMFIIQDISFPGIIANTKGSTFIVNIIEPDKSTLEYFLEYIFRKKAFWEGQFEAVTRALQGRDAIVLLPTGSGKSIAFQLASFMKPGVTIVIDPIISLINDQIDNLERIGIDSAVGITSEITKPEDKAKLIKAFSQGSYNFCYVSPERYQTNEFRNALKSLTAVTPIPLVAIDEAHCVSEWGHDFRTAYLNIGRNCRNFGASGGYVPPILALTGTASSAVLRDVQRELKIEDFDAIITPKTFDRKELHYTIKSCKSSEKANLLGSLITRYIPDQFGVSQNSFYTLDGENTRCGIVFCPHVNGDFGVVKVCNDVRSNGISSEYYSGEPPKYKKRDNWSKYKRGIADGFKNNKFPIMTATKAFGMGIDKPNIRFTVHFGLPASIESFYQEAGRSGRDKRQAECILILSNDDRKRSNKILDMNTSTDDVADRVNNLKREDADDITRDLWFHANSFKGVEEELRNIDEVISKIPELSKKTTVTIVAEPGDRNNMEKAVHRLTLLGLFEDYTIDYSTNEFRIFIRGAEKQEILEAYSKYVAGYNRGRVTKEVMKIQPHMEEEYRQYVKSCCRILVEFIYDTVEKGRRRALREILSLAEKASMEAKCDDIVREGILRYLESSYYEEIEKIVTSDNIGFKEIVDLVDGCELSDGEVIGGIRSPRDAAEVRGQVSRYLESYPDHPGLLLLRALTEVYCNDYDIEIINQNIKAAVDFAEIRYNITRQGVYEMVAWFANKVNLHRNDQYRAIVTELLYSFGDKKLARTLIKYKETEEDAILEPGLYLMNQLAKEANEIFDDEKEIQDSREDKEYLIQDSKEEK